MFRRLAAAVATGGVVPLAVLAGVSAPDRGDPPARLTVAHVAAVAGPENVCGVTVGALDAVSRLESNHGRHGGRTIDEAGRVTPPLRIWDNVDHGGGAHGFLEGTLDDYGVDGDRDGRVDLQDVDDTAASAVRLLCVLGFGDDPRVAFGRYNGG